MLTSGIVEEEGQSQSSENSDGNFSESETEGKISTSYISKINGVSKWPLLLYR